MAYSNDGLGAALDGVTARAGALSLHTADPGTTGAGEAAAVEREAATWPANASGGSVTASQVSFTVPGGEGTAATYTHFGVWDGETFLAGGDLDQSEAFSDNGGQYNFTATLTSASA
ncbi:hypothetical protein [Pseudonocardia sp. McavD-2-B]|uniref:phage tail fiber protein n=1 Tax=Pseudonocardia sp. McavD-2-B TaxID=2954499 RepID=UPI0020978AA7|nr:hypothetical protein [Pseudonocardia sp. McavD-2-B]MCO7195387.1 hypothetical protein [Pseudonocardia sp. McavD-2-B]